MVKREYSIGEMARLSKNMRARGWMLKNGDEVRIVKHKKIDVKHGAYLYDIEATNPKTGNKEVLEGWVTQYDLWNKEMWEEHQRLSAEIRRMENQLKDKENQ